MSKHSTFTGSLGDRVDRLLERWDRQQKKYNCWYPINSKVPARVGQLINRYDKIFEIAERLEAVPQRTGALLVDSGQC